MLDQRAEMSQLGYVELIAPDDAVRIADRQSHHVQALALHKELREVFAEDGRTHVDRDQALGADLDCGMAAADRIDPEQGVACRPACVVEPPAENADAVAT